MSADEIALHFIGWPTAARIKTQLALYLALSSP